MSEVTEDFHPDMVNALTSDAGSEPPTGEVYNGPVNSMTDAEKIEYLLKVCGQTQANVQWLCNQLYSLIKAAENMPGIGGTMMRKGMGIKQ